VIERLGAFSAVENVTVCMKQCTIHPVNDTRIAVFEHHIGSLRQGMGVVLCDGLEGFQCL
jgi:hypothetical protein